MKAKRKWWLVTVTAALTVVLVIIAMNFRAEQNLQYEVEHHYAVADPQFRREMALLGRGIVSGNDITPLQNGDEILPAMLSAIRAAQRTITFETYIYWSGDVGQQFTDALSERAAAGVAVHLIIDWVGSSKMEPAMLEQMQAAGVRLQRYRPLQWYTLDRLNNRTHRKLLVIDGRVGFTGGAGVADVWKGDAQSPDHWRDMHFRVEGPVVGHLQAAFNENWIRTAGEVLDGEAYFPPLPTAGDIEAQLFVSSPAGGSEGMHLMYLKALAAAAESIDLVAAYFVPDDLLLEALVAARQRGVRVRLLLPGEHTDVETVRLASKSTWGDLLLAGIEIYEYQPTMLHTKLLIVDGEFVSVGSTNFDIRSLRINDEASLNIYDREFAAEMTTVFERDLLDAVDYTHARWARRPWQDKLGEALVEPLKSQL